jgi:hypothetical protein
VLDSEPGRALVARAMCVAAQLASPGAAVFGGCVAVAHLCLAAHRAAAAVTHPAVAPAPPTPDPAAAAAAPADASKASGEWLGACARHVAELLGAQIGAAVWGGGAGGKGRDGEDWLQSPLLARGLAGDAPELGAEEELALEGLLQPRVAVRASPLLDGLERRAAAALLHHAGALPQFLAAAAAEERGGGGGLGGDGDGAPALQRAQSEHFAPGRAGRPPPAELQRSKSERLPGRGGHSEEELLAVCQARPAPRPPRATPVRFALHRPAPRHRLQRHPPT